MFLQIINILIDEELETDSIAKLLELAPVKRFKIVSIELCEDRFELTILKWVDHASCEVYHLYLNTK